MVPVVLVVQSMWFCSSPLWTLWLCWWFSPVCERQPVGYCPLDGTDNHLFSTLRHRSAGSPYNRTLRIGHLALVVGHVTALAGNSRCGARSTPAKSTAPKSGIDAQERLGQLPANRDLLCIKKAKEALARKLKPPKGGSLDSAYGRRPSWVAPG